MKNTTVILLTVMCLALYGCSTVKRASKNTRENLQISIVDSSSLFSSSASTLHLTEETIVDILTSSESNLKITEYDTSKPIDEVTGKPPIKREIESISKATEALKANKVFNTVKDEMQDAYTSNIVRTEIEKDVDIEEIQELERKSNIHYYAIIGVVVLILVIVFGLYRYRVFPFNRRS